MSYLKFHLRPCKLDKFSWHFSSSSLFWSCPTSLIVLSYFLTRLLQFPPVLHSSLSHRHICIFYFDPLLSLRIAITACIIFVAIFLHSVLVFTASFCSAFCYSSLFLLTPSYLHFLSPPPLMFHNRNHRLYNFFSLSFFIRFYSLLRPFT